MPAITWLDSEIWFPNPKKSLNDPDGLLCAGGDLSPDRLVMAYRSGIFPWYSEGQPILWWSPEQRCILQFDNLHISRSMRRVINSPLFRYTFNQDFKGVIEACAAPRNYSDETWIVTEMIQAYCRLHYLGIAHSIEVWEDEDLVGGLYGVAIGQCFFGESMFHRSTNASKYAFIKLAQHLESWGYRLFDCQIPNSHLASLGAVEISRPRFLSILEKHIDLEVNRAWTTEAIDKAM